MSTVLAAVEESVAAAISQLPSPESRRSYEYEWRRHRLWLALENLTATEIKPRHISKYVSTLKGAKASNGRALTVLRSMYGALVRDELMLTNPAREVKAPKVDGMPKAPYIDNEGDVEKLLNVPASTWYERRDQTMVRVTFGLGRRRSEVARIAIDDIDGETITATVKGGKQLTVGIPDWVKASIDEWSAFAGIRSGPLFPRRTDDPRPCNGGIVYRVVRQMCARAGITVIPPHGLRRTNITLAGQRGVSLKERQLSVGHSSSATTERYDKARDAARNKPGNVFKDLARKGVT